VLAAIDGVAGAVEPAFKAAVLGGGEVSAMFAAIDERAAMDPLVAAVQTPCLGTGETSALDTLVDSAMLAREPCRNAHASLSLRSQRKRDRSE
jgi:hypothetical protein